MIARRTHAAPTPAPPDVAALIDRLDRGLPRESLEAYDAAVRSWYWDRKDVTTMRAIARAGVRHALTLADVSADPEVVASFRGSAKTIAYNLGSFTWPGWDERGVTLTPTDVADGRDAAELNLRLAILLERPDRALADAWWLIGVHAVASRELAEAADAIAQARAFAVRAGVASRVAMLDGYAALVACLSDPAEIERFDTAVAALRATATTDASAYADQLVTARRVFAHAIWSKPARLAPIES